MDIREWKDDKRTKKGISLNLMRWKNWVDQMEYVDKALVNKQSFIYHLGGNVFSSQLRSEANFCFTCFQRCFVKVVPLALFHFFRNL